MKISINDLRVDKGGDPDKYRRLLSNNNNDDDLIERVLSHDSQRRSILALLENLRSQSSNLQKNVIAPKKKAKEEVPSEVMEQLKEWKVEINRLNDELKSVEKGRDEALREINEIIEASSCNNDVDNKSSSSNDVSSDVDAQHDNNADENNACSDIKNNIEQETTASSEDQQQQQQEHSHQQLPLLSAEQIKKIPPERILNINVGVLGHVDTGKTSLVKTLSSVLSTAALDKSKQSRARGITLDLGFSAFLLPLPEQLKDEQISNNNASSNNESESYSTEKKKKKKNKNIGNGSNIIGNSVQNMNLDQRYDLLQVTLVDCPGHASLIRTSLEGPKLLIWSY